MKATLKQQKQQHQPDITSQVYLQSYKYFYLNKNSTVFNTIKYKNQATSLVTFNNISNLNNINHHNHHNNNNNHNQKYSSYYIYNQNSFYDLSINTRKQWCPIRIESLARYSLLA